MELLVQSWGIMLLHTGIKWQLWWIDFTSITSAWKAWFPVQLGKTLYILWTQSWFVNRLNHSTYVRCLGAITLERRSLYPCSSNLNTMHSQAMQYPVPYSHSVIRMIKGQHSCTIYPRRPTSVIIYEHGIELWWHCPVHPILSCWSHMCHVLCHIHDTNMLSVLKNELDLVPNQQSRKLEYNMSGSLYNLIICQQRIAVSDDEPCQGFL